MLLGKDYVSDFLSRAIRLARQHGFESEAEYVGEEVQGMRSARPGVHQSSIGRHGELTLRLRKGKGAVEVTVSAPAEVGYAVRKARELIASAKPNPLLYPLVEQPSELPEETCSLQKIPRQFWDDLPSKQSAFRAIRRAEGQNREWYGAGNFVTVAQEVGVANSTGLLRYYSGHHASFTCVATGGKRKRQLTTYADGFAPLPQQINYAGVVERAFANARLTDDLPLVEPLHGRSRIQMDAILSPICVADWMSDASIAFSGYLAFRGESFVSHRKQGKARIAGANITLRDDWQDPRSSPLPFDSEGRTRQTVTLVDRGVYANCTYNGMSAILVGTNPTGHSGFELGTDVPDVLVLEGQDHTFEDLVASCDRPAMILSWPHYNSDMYEKEGMWTVTGHHGVFLVRGGRIVAVCPPTRLRLRTFDALKRVEMMSASQTVFGVEHYALTLSTSSVVPWMKIQSVEFLNL